MWTLSQPSIDEVGAHLERALSRDRGDAPYALTAAERDSAVERYKDYDLKSGLAHPDLAESTFSALLGKAVYDAYGQIQKGARLEPLRESLIARAPLCPYCSSPAVTDLDHYLPRSTYADFAIYPRNLIPSCHPCNNVKRAFVPAEANEEHLVHPYFDVFPDEDLLLAQTNLAENGGLAAKFLIEQDAINVSELRSRAQFQLDKFKLDDRLKEAVNVFLAEQETSIRMIHETGGADALSNYLLAAAGAQMRNFGRNDWRVALLRSLALNEEFCQNGFDRALGAIDFGAHLG